MSRVLVDLDGREYEIEDLDYSKCIQTFSGKAFFPLNPRVCDVDIVDIAWSLSMQCRYTGHTKLFYSVAEHCVHLSKAVPIPGVKIEGWTQQQAYTEFMNRFLELTGG